jgi:hypothetical protein
VLVERFAGGRHPEPAPEPPPAGAVPSHGPVPTVGGGS